jgi:addiction module HigA family antidote
MALLPKRGLPLMQPGELLREEILPALDRPKTEIARLLGVSRQTLYDLLEERQPVTSMMTLRLGKPGGNGSAIVPISSAPARQFSRQFRSNAARTSRATPALWLSLRTRASDRSHLVWRGGP